MLIFLCNSICNKLLVWFIGVLASNFLFACHNSCTFLFCNYKEVGTVFSSIPRDLLSLRESVFSIIFVVVADDFYKISDLFLTKSFSCYLDNKTFYKFCVSSFSGTFFFCCMNNNYRHIFLSFLHP